MMYLSHVKVGGHTANTKKIRTRNASLISLKKFQSKKASKHAGMEAEILEVGGVKYHIFTLTYNTHFCSYEHVTNMFLAPFDLKKHLMTILNQFEHHKHIIGRTEAPPWR